MKNHDILEKIKKIDVNPFIDREGVMYRCSAILSDDTYLPCVVIKEAKLHLALVLKRFDETRNNKSLNKFMNYESVVENFVCRGNHMNDYDIKELMVSPYAIPVERMNEIKGETSMSWTEFTVEMDDGKQFPFGTTYSMEFFSMPEGYSADRIKKIIPSELGKPKFRNHNEVYREKPYFVCYV